MARKQRVNHEAVVKFAQKHPEMLQKDIALHFGLSANHVSLILRTAGKGRGHLGRPLKRKRWQSEEQGDWEEILRKLGFGMESGMRIKGQRILYGYDASDQAAF